MSSLWSPKAPSTPERAPAIKPVPETDEFEQTNEQKEKQAEASLTSQRDNAKVRKARKKQAYSLLTNNDKQEI